MIYSNPSDEVLHCAHLITLYDPLIPGWNLVVVDAVDERTNPAPTWNVVDIPVDSTDGNAIQRWRDLIQSARS